MNRKFGATGLMFAVVGGLTASGATSAMAEGLPNVVKELTYEDQNKIYKDLTSNSLGLFGKNLEGTSKDKIIEQLNSLREKDQKKFDEYVNRNYATNSLVSNWEKIPSAEKGGVTPLDELLNKLNNKKEGESKGNLLYNKEYLVRDPYFAIDAAYINGSSLVDSVDKSAVIKKIKDNAKYLGVDTSALSDTTTFSSVYGLVDSSARGEYNNILAKALRSGENVSVSTRLKTKYYATQGTIWAAAASIVAGAFMIGKSLFNKITGKKVIKKSVDTNAVQEQEKEEDIFTPYDEQISVPVVLNNNNGDFKSLNTSKKVTNDSAKKPGVKTTKALSSRENQKQKTNSSNTKKVIE